MLSVEPGEVVKVKFVAKVHIHANDQNPSIQSRAVTRPTANCLACVLLLTCKPIMLQVNSFSREMCCRCGCALKLAC
jgi:hypothetical protein